MLERFVEEVGAKKTPIDADSRELADVVDFGRVQKRRARCRSGSEAGPRGGCGALGAAAPDLEPARRRARALLHGALVEAAAGLLETLTR